MPEFLELLPPPEARARLLAEVAAPLQPEEVDTATALERVSATAVLAPHPLPSFARSTVDGYAVRAEDTYGASETLPAYLELAGEIPMGTAPDFGLPPAGCALIHTGGMLPEGASAVVMLENTQTVRATQIEILRAVAMGENILKMGEDVAAQECVLETGKRLRPAEIGGLMALGLTRVQVVRRPRVGLISSGDEVIPPQAELHPGQVRDVNAYTLSALVEASGGLPVRYGILPDQAEALQAAAQCALSECDVVVITAGSSASTRDLTAQVIDTLGKPGVLVHGVNVRPGKPTILAACQGKAVIGLPGNPVSALVIAGLFVVPVIEKLLGLPAEPVRPTCPAKLSLNLPSQAGREDWVAVRLRPVRFVDQVAAEYVAEPVFGKSNLIFTLARADGLVRIPPAATGLSAGEMVEVILL